MIFRVLAILAVIAVSLWLPSIYKRTLNPFRTGKFLVDLPFKKEWETDCSDAIRVILQQPFSYFAKGQQSYVFLSEDQKYVLKLFLYDGCKIPIGQEILYRCRKWKNPSVFRNELPMQLKVQKTFDSCKLAYDLVLEWTGLVYLHLNPGKKNVPLLHLKDKIGIPHRIDPSRFRFVLQKKCEPFKKTFDSSENKTALVQSFHRMLDRFEELGIANSDPVLGRNFAFLEGQAMAIDVGTLFYDPQKAKESKENFISRLNRFLQ